MKDFDIFHLRDEIAKNDMTVTLIPLARVTDILHLCQCLLSEDSFAEK
jgi:hypothetical protein